MLLILTEPTPNLFVFLNEEDVALMRRGLTKVIDERHLQGKMFSKVILSVVKTNEDARAMLAVVGKKVGDDIFEVKEPKDRHALCNGCQGEHLAEQLLDGRCICCWADEAKKFRVASN